jgi:hypothetical protein
MAKRRNQHNGVDLRRAADVLDELDALTLTLENGEVVQFSIAAELHISRVPEELARQGREAPAQLAFWTAQTERMLVRLRKAEAVLEEAEGKQALVYRQWYEEEEGVTPTESMIRARLSQDVGIRRFRIALRARRKEYGAVRAVKDAVQYRVSMVRTLIGRHEPQ